MTEHTTTGTTSNADAQSVAERVGEKLCACDAVVRSLGITLETISPGRARLQLTVRPDMINGAGICHGGIITTLADAAFAFACNSHNTVTLATAITVDFINPAQLGDVLTATASEISRAGRSGLYDVIVRNQDNKQVAALRGRCHEIRGRHVL